MQQCHGHKRYSLILNRLRSNDAIHKLITPLSANPTKWPNTSKRFVSKDDRYSKKKTPSYFEGFINIYVRFYTYFVLQIHFDFAFILYFLLKYIMNNFSLDIKRISRSHVLNFNKIRNNSASLDSLLVLAESPKRMP